MKVYVITKGCYSDYHICGVTLDYAIAQELVERFGSDWAGPAQIEEYDTNCFDEALRWKNVYYCSRFRHNKITAREWCLDEVNTKEINDVYFRQYDQYFGVSVYANSEEEAIKKAADLFAKYEAEKLDL